VQNPNSKNNVGSSGLNSPKNSTTPTVPLPTSQPSKILVTLDKKPSNIVSGGAISHQKSSSAQLKDKNVVSSSEMRTKPFDNHTTSIASKVTTSSTTMPGVVNTSRIADAVSKSSSKEE
jgi:hypothetical protein